MIINKKKLLFLILLGSLIFLGSVTVASAITLISEDFDSLAPGSSWPSAWTPNITGQPGGSLTVSNEKFVSSGNSGRFMTTNTTDIPGLTTDFRPRQDFSGLPNGNRYVFDLDFLFPTRITDQFGISLNFSSPASGFTYLVFETAGTLQLFLNGVNVSGRFEQWIPNQWMHAQWIIDPDLGISTVQLNGNPINSFSLPSAFSLSSLNSTNLTLKHGNISPVYVDNISLITTSASLPVPSAIWLFGSGLIGLIGVARRSAI